jgi:uncharacterized protein YodC (DUF2158 family)
MSEEQSPKYKIGDRVRVLEKAAPSIPDAIISGYRESNKTYRLDYPDGTKGNSFVWHEDELAPYTEENGE